MGEDWAKPMRKIGSLYLVLIAFLGSILLRPQTSAQGNEWVWTSGASTLPATCPLQSQGYACGSPGVYGTLGEPSTANTPGGREQATSWTDKSGNLWLFGGIGYDSAGARGTLNDLWEFSVSSHEWTWMSGSATVAQTCRLGLGACGQSGVYGTLGVAAAGNAPGGREWASGWTDGNGNLWLFGGYGYDSVGMTGNLNDLWEFNPTTKEWAWMGGNSTLAFPFAPGVYGTLGVAAAGNQPGGRVAAASWTDGSGNLWLFGGEGYDSIASGIGFLNDLWEFNPANNEWAWMGGASTLVIPVPGCNGGGQCEYYAPGAYGALGTPAPGNVPPGRSQAIAWTDASGNVWLFGGQGYSATGSEGSSLNDVWELNVSTNEWAWMGGSDTNGCYTNGLTYCGQPGVYGTMGTPAAGNIPGGRAGAVGGATGGGKFLLFGGWGFDSTTTDWGLLNDLWEFDPSTNKWAWVGGSSVSTQGNETGIYGTFGLGSASNLPGGREQANSWIDDSGNLWLFGGWGFDSTGNPGDLNDLWEYGQPSTFGQLAATPTFGVPAGTYKSAQTVTLSDATPNATIYYTTDGSTPTASSTVYSAAITVSSSETIQAIATASGYLASAVASANYTINLPVAATPAFSVAAGTYTSAQTVTLSDATPNATIYYTTDGSTPTTSSTVYTAPIPVSASETINAIATASGYLASAVASANYTINLPVAATPTFSVAAGTYTSAQTVTLSDATPNATIYYTTDGSTPTASSTVYSAPIAVSASETINAIATANGYTTSGVASATYTINLPPASFTLAASPASISMNGGGSGSVTLTVTPQNGFNAAVTFTCSGLPAGVTCSFNPSSVTPSGGAAASTQLTISASQSAALHGGSGSYLPLTTLALVGCFAGLRRRRDLLSLVVIVAAVVGLGLVSGCGGGGGSNGGGGGSKQPVTATVTVTATSGSIQQTSNISLTVN